MKSKKENGDPRFGGNIYINWKILVGKTVKSINTDLADNIVGLSFTDGSEFVVDSEPIGNGLFTPVIDTLDNYK